ncbi:hypothetical protein EWM64_g10765 [Hericium alpestre]|uniref:Uncharacterized protein n=1 Tax=Hericium alpestre TaxID=135208 RepID=A0A4Y9ZGV2_9AGAM|nr:hypothetical protein EWM64_g10765 [Hericium alpestre]
MRRRCGSQMSRDRGVELFCGPLRLQSERSQRTFNNLVSKSSVSTLSLPVIDILHSPPSAVAMIRIWFYSAFLKVRELSFIKIDVDDEDTLVGDVLGTIFEKYKTEFEAQKVGISHLDLYHLSPALARNPKDKLPDRVKECRLKKDNANRLDTDIPIAQYINCDSSKEFQFVLDVEILPAATVQPVVVPQSCYAVYMPHGRGAQCIPFNLPEEAKVEDLQAAICGHREFKRALEGEDVRLYKGR